MNSACDEDDATPSSPDDKRSVVDTGDGSKKPTNDAAEKCSDPNFNSEEDKVTSQVLKIEIKGFPRTCIIKYKEIRGLLSRKLNLKTRTVTVTKKFPQLVFATFRCEEDLLEAIKKVSGFVWKGQKLTAEKVVPVAVPLVKKRKADLSNESESVKELKRKQMRRERENADPNGKKIMNSTCNRDNAAAVVTSSSLEDKETVVENSCKKPVDAAAEECPDTCFCRKATKVDPQDFKIQLEGLPRNRVVGHADVKILLKKKLNLKPHEIKVTKTIPQSVFVAFSCEEDGKEAIKKITGRSWKGSKLTAKEADPWVCMFNKPKLHFNTENPTELPVALMVKNARTPLWELSYEAQLKNKEQEILKTISKLTQSLNSFSPHLLANIKPREGKDEKLCCPLEPIVGSPITTGYLNTCYFTVGLHPQTGLPSVGYSICSYKHLSKCVAEPTHCSNTPPIMRKCAELFQTYIRASPLPIFNHKSREGFWRQLTVRTSRKEHLLLIVILHPQNLTEEEVAAEKTKLKEYFSNSDVKVTSLCLRRFVNKKQEEVLLEHISGTHFIEEELLGLRLRISPGASFHANTLGAEVLYTTLPEFTSLTKETTVVDLYCGMGTTGLVLAKHVQKVIGVDQCQAAVEDAKYNAQANDIENAEFLCGGIEELLVDVFSTKITAEDEDIVAILEPPGALSKDAIKAIRGIPRLKRLVFLSNKPEICLSNFVDLCRPVSHKFHGSPFMPVKAVAMDLLPQTNQCELIVLFEK